MLAFDNPSIRRAAASVRARAVRKFGALAVLTLALAMPVQDAAAQDPLLGGLFGGAAGAIIGGAAGGRRGVAIGAIIGAATGAIIAAEGRRHRGGYYYWRGGCYLRRPGGVWFGVAPSYCGWPGYYPPAAYYPPPAYYPPYAYYAPSAAIAYCARRYRSYDPVTQTFLGYDGLRHPCP
jgi:hypothetical protein